jgi:hypothetical protein
LAGCVIVGAVQAAVTVTVAALLLTVVLQAVTATQ